MRLFFLRHGEAVEAGEWKGGETSRPLTAEGVDILALEAAGMKEMGLAFDRVIASPLERAKKTAEIIAKGLDLPDKPAIDDRLTPGFDANQLAKILAENKDADSLLLVGHEPDLSSTIGKIIGGGNLQMKKGSLALVKLENISPPRGELALLLSPKALARGKKQ